MVKRVLRKAARLLKMLPDHPNLEDCDFAYHCLNGVYNRLMAKDGRGLRPNYTWAMIQAAYLASSIEVERISAIEFGVAGGNGLLALERAAEKLEGIFSIGIEVYGFDSGHGLPKSQDYRDVPNLWSAGSYPMDEQKLRAQLKHAQLILGLVEETVPDFLKTNPAPIGFISFDLDLYSSTVQAFKVLEADQILLMPRIYCYFDDILGFSFGHHNGERLAMSEFNATHRMRQISEIYGVRYYLPPEMINASWSEKMFMAHILDHKHYNKWDRSVRNARMDLK